MSPDVDAGPLGGKSTFVENTSLEEKILFTSLKYRFYLQGHAFLNVWFCSDLENSVALIINKTFSVL